MVCPSHLLYASPPITAINRAVVEVIIPHSWLLGNDQSVIVCFVLLCAFCLIHYQGPRGNCQVYRLFRSAFSLYLWYCGYHRPIIVGFVMIVNDKPGLCCRLVGALSSYYRNYRDVIVQGSECYHDGGWFLIILLW